MRGVQDPPEGHHTAAMAVAAAVEEGMPEREAFLAAQRPAGPSIHLDDLPDLAVRFVRAINTEPLPEIWPVLAAERVRWLQKVLLLCIGLGLLSILFAEVEAFRALQLWHRTGGKDSKCDVPLRPWIGSHACLLALVPWLSAYCGFMALASLTGWAVWGLILVQEHARLKHKLELGDVRGSAGKCDGRLLRMAWELIGADCVLIVMAVVSCCVAACAFVVAVRATEAAMIWDPESYLEITLQSRLQETLDEEQGGDDMDRACAICWANLVEPPGDLVVDGGSRAEGTAMDNSGGDLVDTDSKHEGSVATIAACGHRFHLQCVLPWLRTKRTCPICRARADGPRRRPPFATGSSTSNSGIVRESPDDHTSPLLDGAHDSRAHALE